MIIHGDSIEVLKTVENESVDLLCTDPPYGYSFMGKSWDKTLPDIGIFKECLRVLKPGAFAFVMSAPRSDVQYRMIELIEKAGFDVGFTPLYHTYASGFPKAQNVHKKLTKNEEAREHELQELWRAVIHSSSPTEQSEHRSYLSSLLADLEQGEQREISFEDLTREEIQVSERQRKSCVERWSNLSEEERKLWGCEVCTMPRGLYVNGAKRWICYGTPNHSGDFTWEVADENGSRTSYKSRLHGQSFGKLDALCKQCRAQKIRTLNGAFSGWQPKPAVEVIIVAMKPLSEKTYVDQALKNGKGITWLDDCRVPTTSDTRRNARGGDNGLDGTQTFKIRERRAEDQIDHGGRFPANLLVSDDVLGDEIPMPRHHCPYYNDDCPKCKPKDVGSYSRYFDLDAFFKQLCDTYPTLREWESSGASRDNASERSNARTDLLDAAGRLYDSLDTLAGSVLGGNSWRTFLRPSDDGYARSWKSLLDFRGGYPSYSRLRDAHARLDEASDQELLRLLDDVHKQALPCLRSDGQADSDAGIVSSYLAACAVLPIILEVGETRQFNTDTLPESVRLTLPFLIVPKAAKSEKNAGLDVPKEKNPRPIGEAFGNGSAITGHTDTKGNHHPTVKPLKLMSYLITLGSRPGDVVLDPFLGSGTTALAAKQLGRKYIGIEREAEYVEIAEARLQAVPDTLKL